MIGVPTEIEPSLISERPGAGAKAANAGGGKSSRNPKLTPQQIAHVQKLIEQGEDRQTAAVHFKVEWKTLYRALAA
jgi:DNA invertase Pin-like site-specific DNA recombinase